MMTIVTFRTFERIRENTSCIEGAFVFLQKL